MDGDSASSSIKITPHLTIPVQGNYVEFIKPLGNGAQAKVWQVIHTSALGKRDLAMKFVAVPATSKNRSPFKEQLDRLKEVEFHAWKNASAHSKSVLDFHEAFDCQVRIAEQEVVIRGFFMPYSPLGDLLEYSRKHLLPQLAHNHGSLATSNLDVRNLRSMLKDVAYGVKAAHDLEIIHCDIKPTNVLVFDEDGRPCAKLMDFGGAVSREKAFADVFSPAYAAPELLRNERPTPASDIYSLGLTFFEVIVGHLPGMFVDHNQVVSDTPGAIEAHRLKTSFDLSEVGRRMGHAMQLMISGMLRDEAGLRSDITSVIESLHEQETLSIVAGRSVAPHATILRPNCYRWDPAVHETLGSQLHYTLFAGISPHQDLEWIETNFRENHISGYSIYRITGGYDYLMRSWIGEDQLDAFHQILERFPKHQGGGGRIQTFSCIPKLSWGWYRASHGKRNHTHDRASLIQRIRSCANEDNAATEFENLRNARLVANDQLRFPTPSTQSTAIQSLPKRSTRPKRDAGDGIRFFVTLKSTERLIKHHYSLESIGNWLTTKLFESPYMSELLGKNALAQYGLYAGLGDWSFLLKFRLADFFKFASLLHEVEKKLAMVHEHRFTSQTFVEIDKYSHVESDDGTIISLVNEHATHEANRELGDRP